MNCCHIAGGRADEDGRDHAGRDGPGGHRRQRHGTGSEGAPGRRDLRSAAQHARPILVLSSMGVGMVELEVSLHVLLVTFQAMKRSGHTWPVVSEDVQEVCMQRLTARARFNEGLLGASGLTVLRRASRALPARVRVWIPRRPRLAACAHRGRETPVAGHP